MWLLLISEEVKHGETDLQIVIKLPDNKSYSAR
jgi:hypothetical protein